MGDEVGNTDGATRTDVDPATFRVLDDTVDRGVRIRSIAVEGHREAIPTLVWSPVDPQEGARGSDEAAVVGIEHALDERPAVLLGHGGTQHKAAPNLVALARHLVEALRCAVVAIDAPGHGDRVTEAERQAFRQAVKRIDPSRPRNRGDATAPYSRTFVHGVADWHCVVAALGAARVIAAPFGWWGVSMGTSIGLPFIVEEARVRCAVLGLASTVSRPGHAAYLDWAARYDRPLLFLCQRDDGGHPIGNALELFDTFGSNEKTMHVNPGGHVEVPSFERQAAVQFFARHLGNAGGPR